ncbi:MAG: phenylalanine--tRNA ligase subunit alpha [Candidatus Eiseniibacteriota bacterium]|nr:MAG: phenylalanine--tRNA ligase subunit alpha [Candidatus Eisenbacteria bacterium]
MRPPGDKVDTEKSVRELRESAAREIESASTARELEEARVKYLGRKGLLTSILRGIANLGEAERAVVGKAANRAKEELTSLIAGKRESLEQGLRDASPRQLDVTLPGTGDWVGSRHILSRVARELREMFVAMGFSVATGPDVEDAYHNFEALNIPEGHPAREQGDTFFVKGGLLLRTHTSPVQIRVMEETPPPIRMIFPGRVYRNDAPDPTHSPEFHQLECLYVDRGVTFQDLKGTLAHFARRFFGSRIGVRFRPFYFPFTEPSAEVDITCIACSGGREKPASGTCRMCGGTGWLEILGAGMVHPAVFRHVGYDPEQFTGYAFGAGIERLAMLKYGITDIRFFLENDLRFLEQFA